MSEKYLSTLYRPIHHGVLSIEFSIESVSGLYSALRTAVISGS